MGTIVAIYFAVTAASLAVIGYLIYDGMERRRTPCPSNGRDHNKRRRPH